MTTDAKQRERALFEQLVELAGAAERRAFLDDACRDDPALRLQLEELFALQESADALLAPPPVPSAEELDTYDGVGRGGDASRIIGRYRLLSRLGAGGCGVVYLAEQREPVRRQVALKIIRLGMDTESVIARFELERQSLAIMDHPNIARVLDAGTTDSGRPYFVMELVQGIKITDYCARHRLTTEQRLRLFGLVCHAIQHAHQKGIVHRDIKPSNILVAAHDGHPVPKVIDFGIAKAVEGRLGETAGLTVHFQPIGTPAYMSPEQADFGNPDLDTRSDIYSLGVLLHELLTGRTPFDGGELATIGLDEMRRVLRERETPRPSAVLAALPPAGLRALAEQHRTEPARLLAAVRGDLDWIVTTAMEKDRRRRYETANGLAMDIRRYLAHELVAARPPSRLYRLGKLVRRNRVVFISGLLILVSLLAGLGTSTWLLLREREARREQARLLMLAEASEKIARAAVLLTYGKKEEADALVAAIPDDRFRPSLECSKVLSELGEWHAVNGHWDDSARLHFLLARVITRADENDSDKVSYSLMPAGTAIREQGDLARYETFRNDIVARFANTRDPVPAEQVLKASLLAPCSPDLMAKLAPLAAIVSATVREVDPAASTDRYLDAWRSFVLALYAERRGDPDEVLYWCERAWLYHNTNQPREISVELLQAMALLRLGRREEAARLVAHNRDQLDAMFQSQLATGVPTPDGWVFWFDWINARLLLREATGRLGGLP